MPRLGKAGRDNEDDVVAAIVVMNRTLHTNDVVPRIKAEVEKINSDGTLPPGVKLVPFYDRTILVSVTTHTVLHNLIFGCLLVFLVQWVFLGNLRSAIIVGINIPFALFFSIIILVLRGEDANLLSVGAVDFGIIIDSAVILVENIFRNFQARPEERQALLWQLAEEKWGADPTSDGDRRAANVDRPAAADSGQRAAGGQGGVLFHGDHGRRVRAVVHDAGRRRPDLQPDGANLRLRADWRVAGDVHHHARARLLPPSRSGRGGRDHRRPGAARDLYAGAALVIVAPQASWSRSPSVFCVVFGLLVPRLGTEFLPALEEGNLWIRAAMPPTISLEAGMPIVDKIRGILLSHPEVITVVSQHGRPDNGSDAAGFNNAEFFVPLKPFDEWPPGMTKEKLINELQTEFSNEFAGYRFQFLAIHSGQCRGRPLRRQGRQFGEDHRPRSWRSWSSSPTRS